MSKVGGLGVHEVGGYLLVKYIHSECIRHTLLVFNAFFMTTSNFGGAQPPLIKKGGVQAPPAPPGSLPLEKVQSMKAMFKHSDHEPCSSIYDRN